MNLKPNQPIPSPDAERWPIIQCPCLTGLFVLCSCRTALSREQSRNLDIFRIKQTKSLASDADGFHSTTIPIALRKPMHPCSFCHE
ncbi:hypothetical protein ASPVEDRAFT_592525 [Aspergillus versicolor CBS 583.65]|uniref:Uncharacterized protein n=1 Tax=Aspergillus versicolor CBS 583.65 TaxID=1036611 RepID=A0A1L9PHE9_ASPVE|nr:uncharacterized protein ASPVEDRAFT_592525 [Aspergillus versicolor CBS 583.65]OJJ00886.1 hypothetical protein ASPVEDRAFT_592525 [Aspergillus versicolor CBS 583.65]